MLLNNELLKAAQTHEVPKSTLQDRVAKYRKNSDLILSSSKRLGRFKPIFSSVHERTLVEHILAMESRLFGVTYKGPRRPAFRLANKISHTFNQTEKLTGEDWRDVCHNSAKKTKKNYSTEGKKTGGPS